MIEDIRTLAPNSVVEADVCVVGAGAAGLTLAAELLGAGARVLLVESGGSGVDGRGAELNGGEVVGLPHWGLAGGRVRGLGGTTQVWPGQLMRLEREDFEPRPWLEHSGGWPLRLEDFEQYYERAQTFLGIAPDAFHGDVWRLVDVRPPTFESGRLRVVYSTFATRPHVAKHLKSTLRHSKHVSVLLNATVCGMETIRDRSRLERLTIRSPEGRELTCRPAMTILCGGAIENARLLLASAIGNEHDLVGRFFQDHAVGKCAALEVPPGRDLQETFGLFFRGDRRLYPKVLLDPQVQAEANSTGALGNVVYEAAVESPVEAALRLRRLVKGRGQRTSVLRDGWLVVRGAGEVAASLRSRYQHGHASIGKPAGTKLLAIVEQAPNPDSRVSLAESHDPLGVPKARLDWRLGEPERRALEALAQAVAVEFEHAGLARVRVDDWMSDPLRWTEHMQDSAHPAGTTRMHVDPREGVVDANCRVHGLENLFVCGSSVFPTSGTANPTLTIVALAIRLADHLRRG